MNILEQLAEHARERAARAKASGAAAEIRGRRLLTADTPKRLSSAAEK